MAYGSKGSKGGARAQGGHKLVAGAYGHPPVTMARNPLKGRAMPRGPKDPTPGGKAGDHWRLGFGKA